MSGALAGIREILSEVPDSSVVRLDGRNCFEGSYEAVTAWLPADRPGRYLIAAVNDPSALGALSALAESGQGSFVAVGQSATPAARQEMRHSGSKLIGSVAYFPERYGADLIRLGITLIENKPVPQSNFVSHRLITSANVDRLYPEDRHWPANIPDFASS